MRVAVDAHNLLSDRRGIAVYLRAVLGRWLRDDACDLTLLVRGAFPNFARPALARMFPDARFRIANRVPRECDVVWHPWNGIFFYGGRRSVATVHDVIPFALPDGRETIRRSQTEPFLRTARTAHRLMTDSEFSRDEIVRYLRYDRRRIAVVPLAADDRFFPGEPRTLPENVRTPYVLYVGTQEPRKNFTTLFRAWERVPEKARMQLVVVSLEALPQPREGLVRLGPLGFETLRNLYRGALCVAVPSTYEGFGLPALEAMACGAPAIVSRAASLPEVCGDAVLYVDDPLDVTQWTGALQRMRDDENVRDDLRVRGPERAKGFSWKRTASEALDVIRAATAKD